MRLARQRIGPDAFGLARRAAIAAPGRIRAASMAAAA